MGISLDSCCGAPGAFCEEHLEELKKQPHMYNKVVKKVVMLEKPLSVKGVEGQGRVQILGHVWVWVEFGISTPTGERIEEAKLALLRQGSTGFYLKYM